MELCTRIEKTELDSGVLCAREKLRNTSAARRRHNCSTLELVIMHNTLRRRLIIWVLYWKCVRRNRGV